MSEKERLLPRTRRWTHYGDPTVGFGEKGKEGRRSSIFIISTVQLAPQRGLSLRSRVIGATLLIILNFSTQWDSLVTTGVLPSMQEYFALSDSSTGFLGTSHTVVTLLSLVLLGYAGDRFNRKALMLVGMTTWVVAAGLSGYVPSQLFWLFCLLRALTAFGSATMNVLIAPTLGDYFSGTQRGYAIMFLSAASLFANLAAVSGGSAVVAAGLSWIWVLRIAPPLVLICLVTAYFFLPEPVRGDCDNAEDIGFISHSVLDDLRSLLRVKTYIRLVTATFFLFASTTALVSWGPTLLQRAMSFRNNSEEIYHGFPLPALYSVISAGNMASYLLGIFAGTTIAESWRVGRGIFSGRSNRRAVPLTQAIGIPIGLLFQIINLLCISSNLPLFFASFAISTFFGSVMLPLSTRIILDVIPPNRRSLAMATQSMALTFLSAPIPLVFGSLVDFLRGEREDAASSFISLLWAMLAFTLFSLATAPALMFYTAASYPQDAERMKMDTDEMEQEAKEIICRTRNATNVTI